MDEEARALLRRMDRWHVTPNAETYSWFINTMGRKTKVEDLDLIRAQLSQVLSWLDQVNASQPHSLK